MRNDPIASYPGCSVILVRYMRMMLFTLDREHKMDAGSPSSLSSLNPETSESRPVDTEGSLSPILNKRRPIERAFGFRLKFMAHVFTPMFPLPWYYCVPVGDTRSCFSSVRHLCLELFVEAVSTFRIVCNDS